MKTTSALVILGLVITTGSVPADDKWDVSKLDVSKLPPPVEKKGVTYAADIRPLFEASCFRCHGDDRPKGGLRLNNLEAVLKGGEDGQVVVPGDSKKSLLVVAAARIDDETAMPPKRGPGGPGGPGGFGGGQRQGPPPGGLNATNRPVGGPGGGGRGPGGPGGPGGSGGGFGPPQRPLTPEQVGLVRAWIDQGAK
jgi:hypothetical protein